MTNAVSNINNTSGAGTGGYTNNFATVSGTAYPGQIVNFSLTPSTGTNYFYIWVDWNNDLDFADANETIAATTSYTSTYSAPYTIPAAQATGTYRMRVAQSWSGAITACGPAANGEYEDYAINIVTAPTCFAPASLTVSNLTDISATLTWLAATPAPDNGYEWYLSTSSTNPTQATPASGSVGAGVLTANISVTPNTQYYLWIRSVCSGSDFSYWTNTPVTFKSYCNPIANFSENFDAVTVPALPTCWTGLVRGTQVDTPYVRTSTTNFSAPNSVYLYNGGSTATELILISPYLSNAGAGTHQLRLYARNGTASQDIIIGTLNSNAPDAVFTPLQTVDINTTFAEYVVSFATYTGTDKFIGIKRLNTSTYTSVYVDNINWEVIPTCYPPTAVTATLPTVNGITLNWTAPVQGVPVDYQYEVRTSGAPGSGAVGLAATGNVPAGTVTVTLNTLNPSMTYTVYMRTFCGGSDYSAWTLPVNFNTVCVPVASLPWTENFDSMPVVGDQILPNCWSSTARWLSSIADTYAVPNSGTKHVRYKWSSTNEFLWTPAFQLEAGKSYRFSFWAAGDGYATWVNDVFVNTSAAATGATQLGTSFSPTGPGSLGIQPYTQVSRTYTAPATGTYYFAIRGNQSSSTPWYMSFDDFSVSEAPTSITGFAPAAVCEGGGSVVTITGTSFNGATAVAFNGVAAQSFTVVNNTTISAVSPAGVTPGAISVTAPLGSATSASNFTVNPMPVVSPITNGDVTLCSEGTVLMENETPGGVWASSNPEIATIDNLGNVVAVGVGTSTISYSVTDNGCTTSATVVVTVNEAIQSTNPLAQTVVTGTDAVYSVTATGAITGYQWMVSNDGGDTFTNLVDDAVYSGVNTNTLTIDNTPGELNENLYMVVISAESPCDAFESAAAVLNVGDTGIASDPGNVELCSTGEGIAVFTVVASGTTDNTYAWEEDQGLGFMPITDGTVGGITYSGATTDELTVSNVGTANSNWYYRAVVTGPANGATSNPATLIVNEGVAITTDPASTSTCYSGGDAVFAVAASGAVTGYQWQYSTDNVTFSNVANNTPVGASYSGVATATLTVATTAATPAAGTYFYRAVVSGEAPCPAVESAGAQLSIYAPVVSAQPAPASVFAGNTATFTVATSEPSPSYQWQYAAAVGGPWTNVVNNTPTGITYTDATSATLSVNVLGNAPAAANRYYRAVVTSGGCSVNSDAALLTTTNYCFPTYTAGPGTVDQIANVSVGTLNNASGPSTSPYYVSFDNATIPDLQRFTTANVSVKFGNDTANYGAVWIDFNQNGIFEASEGVASTASSAGTSVANGTSVISIPVPLNAVLGKTRMRVRGGDDVAISLSQACGASNDVDGEAEDYFVNITPEETCSAAPAAATVTSSSPSVCLSGSVTLTASGIPTGITGLTTQWYNTVDGLISGATNATYTTPVLTANASYFFRITCSTSGLFSDSNTFTVEVNNPSVVSTTPATRCGTGTVNLSATGSAGTNLNWYAAETGGTVLYTGTTFTTPSISSNTTYYVSATAGGASEAGGKIVPTGIATYIDTQTGIVFNATTAFTLNSANIYAVGTGTITVGLYNSSGTELMATPVIPVTGLGTSTPVTIPINFAVPVGTGYRLMVKAYTGLTGIVRDVAASNTFPYTTPSCSVTGGYFLGASSAYYFFYNLGITTGCESSRTPVLATVNSAPALTLSGSTAAICSGASTGLVTITSNVADYDSYVWSPSTGVSGTAATGFTFNPTSTTAYTLTATQSGGSQCSNTATFNVTVNPIPAALTVTPAASTICAGSSVALTVGAPAIVGTGTTLNASNTGATAYPAPYGAYYENAKQQYLIRASELTALGLVAGSPLKNISFDVTTLNGSGVHTAYTISIGNTAQTAIATWETGLTTVFGPVNYQPVAGLNTHTFNTPFVWNGTSNIVVQICHSNDTAAGPANFTANALSKYSTTAFNSSLTYRVDNTDACGNNTITYTEAQRPNMVFNFVDGTVTWSPTAGLYTDVTATTPYTGGNAATVYAKPATTSSYTATLTSPAGCPAASLPAVVTVNQFYDFYADVDGDGYGTGSPVSLCSTSASVAPAGYSVNNTDCNDAALAINPGAAEVPFNGIDDNCNETIDEGSQLLSQVLASQCGTTLATISSLVGAVSFGAPVDGYRFEVTDMQTSAVQTIDRVVPNFQLTALATYDYARTYSIRVMLRRNGIWLNYYGPSCLVSTPAVLDTGGAAAVTPSQCGITLASISTLIATTSLPGVTGYRFRVTNMTDANAPNQVQTLDRNLHWFALTMLNTFTYGTTYTVEVAVKTNGAYSGFGAPCTVTTPAVPTITNPGTATSGGMLFYTTSLNRVTSYRFELTYMDGDFTTTIIDRPSHYFSFSQVPGYVPSGNYAVRVAVMTSGVWSLYGEAAMVTAPGAARGVIKGDEPTAGIEFRAVAYPNPYAEGFSLDMDTPSEERIQVKVYDMIGKLLEDREYAVDQIEMQQFGERYPSGVYNVIVTQGGFVKTLRVIKR